MQTASPRIVEALKLFRFEWDPIGLGSNPDALDEYDSYALKAWGMYKNGATVDDVTEYLGKTQTENIGLQLTHANNRGVAEKLKGIISRDVS